MFVPSLSRPRRGRGPGRGWLAIATARSKARGRVRPSAEALEGRRLLAVTSWTSLLVNPVEGAPFTGRVGQFSTDDPLPHLASNYAASIQWGDGNTSAGTIAVDAFGQLEIVGSNTYAEEGNRTITILIHDLVDNTTATELSSASVADAPLTSQGATVAAVEGLSVSAVVATFQDADPNGVAGDYTAMIDWGDGTAQSGGSIVVFGAPNGVTFRVSGSHTYAEEGAFPISVTIDDAGGASTIASGQAVVADAALTADGVPVRATAGTPLDTTTVATFIDTGGAEPIGEYHPLIDWGDGTPASPGVITGFNVINGPNGLVTQFTVGGRHTFASAGTFPASVSIRADGGASVDASFTATAVAPTLTCSTITVREGSNLNNVMLAKLAGANSPPPAGNFYSVAIDWGDGTPIVPGSIDGSGVIRGSHTFEESGTYPVRIVVGASGNPNVVAATCDLTVTDVPITLSGLLDPADDTGLSNADGITNDNTPSFVGFSEPGSIVTLYRPTQGTGGMTLIPLNQTVADAGGFWRINTLPLPDGTYDLVVKAVDRAGKTSATLNLAPLTIDTVGPQITDLIFDRPGGRVGVTFQDDRSGMDLSTLLDGANYRFTGTDLRGRPRDFFVTSLVPILAPNPKPTDPVGVVATLNGGQPIRGGRFTVTVRSGSLQDFQGVRDLAGNPLDGDYFGYFPSGNGLRGGDFVAGISSVHNVVFSPVPVQNGFATPLNPPGNPASSFTIGTPPAQGPRKRAATKHPAGPKAAAHPPRARSSVVAVGRRGFRSGVG